MKRETCVGLVSIDSEFHIKKIEGYDYYLIICVIEIYVDVVMRRIVIIK